MFNFAFLLEFSDFQVVIFNLSLKFELWRGNSLKV